MPLVTRLLAPVFALLLAAAQSSGTSAPADPPTVQPDLIVPLYLSNDRALAMLRIGDRPPAPVVFDTGTEGNVLDSAFAASIGLKQIGTAPLIDAATGRSFTVPTIALPDSSLGGAPLGEATAETFDYRERDAVGIFGPNAFAGSLVYLELGKSRIRTRRKDASSIPSSPSIPYGDALPSIPVALPGGIVVVAHLDSGSTGTLSLPLALAGKLPLEAPPTVIGKAVSIGGEQDVLGARLKGIVRIGSVTLENPEVSFMGERANVGLPVIRRLTMILDPAGRRAWVLVPSALSAAKLDHFAGRYGARRISRDGARLVYQRDGRPAAPLDFLGQGLFENPATGDRVQFWGGSGKSPGFDLVTADGQILPVARTG